MTAPATSPRTTRPRARRAGPPLPPDGRRRVPAGHALLVMLIALVAAAFLNGESLVHTAERQPYGGERDLALVAARPTRFLGELFLLDVPRRAFEALIDHEELESDSGFGAGLPQASVPRSAEPDVGGPPAGPGQGQDPRLGPTPEAPVASIPQTYRRPTVADPLRVFFVGDSVIGNISTGFGQVYSGEGRMTIAVDFRVSTGLARPDVLDWPTYLARILQERDDEVVVMMFGANDDQDMQTPDGRAALFTDEWVREYARRVGIMMDVARDGGRTVVWLGLPAVDVDRLEQARRVMNRAARVEAATRPDVEYVNLGERLTPGGAYQQMVDGVRARENDGVHVTISGAQLVAADVYEAFADTRNLRSGSAG
jgi:uncharacterized protein